MSSTKGLAEWCVDHPVSCPAGAQPYNFDTKHDIQIAYPKNSPQGSGYLVPPDFTYPGTNIMKCRNWSVPLHPYFSYFSAYRYY